MSNAQQPVHPPAREQDPGRLAMSVSLLEDFAVETGLTSERPARRYLWTDAFAVCGFLALYSETGQQRFLDLALRLVDEVHNRLGRHRADSGRTGWISGLDDESGAAHPTAGGLRIGKDEPERQRGEPYDARSEWNRDGQYYHYLTRWMHALIRVWRVTGDARYHRWAVELALAAHRGFFQKADSFGNPWIVWKMSVDLSRPLVPSSGLHDPLDGRIVVETLRATAPESVDSQNAESDAAARALDAAARDLDALCSDRSWATDDPLGVGGLLTDCLRLAQLRSLEHRLAQDLEAAVLGDAQHSLAAFANASPLDVAADDRLAFRELGLAIGLHAAERLIDQHDHRIGPAPESTWTDAVRAHLNLAPRIEAFWCAPQHRHGPAWTEHRHINAVMLAASLTPSGYLDL